MRFKAAMKGLGFTVVFALAAVQAVLAAGEGAPKPKVVRLTPDQKEYVRVLGGPPETVTMRSGFVFLAPGDSVGKHSTETYEEAVVVLAGSGEMRSPEGAVLVLVAPCVAYCPPHTEHDVVNTGAEPLRYVYIVAKAAVEESR